MSIYRTTSVAVYPSFNKLKVLLTFNGGHIRHEYISRPYKTSSSGVVYGVFIRRILDKVKSVLSFTDNSPTTDIPLLSPIRGSSSNILDPFKWSTNKYSITVSNIKATLNNRVYILKKTVATPKNVVPLSTIEYKFPEEKISNSVSNLSSNSELLSNTKVDNTILGDGDYLNNKRNQVLYCSLSKGEELNNNSTNERDIYFSDNAIRELNGFINIYAQALDEFRPSGLSDSGSKYIDLSPFSLNIPNRETKNSKSFQVGEYNNTDTSNSTHLNENNSSFVNLEEHHNNFRNVMVLNPKVPKLRTVFYFQNKSVHVILPSKVDDGISSTVHHISTVYKTNNSSKPARINFIEFHKIPAENSPPPETTYFGPTETVLNNYNAPNLIVYKKQTSIPLENNNNRFWIPEKYEKTSSNNIPEYLPKQYRDIFGTEDTSSTKTKKRSLLSDSLMKHDKSDTYISKIPIQKDKLIDETVVPNKSILNIINSIDKSTVIIQKDLYITDQILRKIKNDKKSKDEKNKVEARGIEDNRSGHQILTTKVQSIEKDGQLKLLICDMRSKNKHFNNVVNPKNSKEVEKQESIYEVSEKNVDEVLLLESCENGDILLLKPISKNGKEDRVTSFSFLGSAKFRKVFTTDLIKKAAAIVEKEKYREKKQLEEEEHNKTIEKINKKEYKSSSKTKPTSYNSAKNSVYNYPGVNKDVIDSHTLFEDAIKNMTEPKLKINQKSNFFQNITNKLKNKEPCKNEEYSNINSADSTDFLSILNEKLNLAINKRWLNSNNTQQKANSISVQLNGTKTDSSQNKNPESITNINSIIPCPMTAITNGYNLKIVKSRYDSSNLNILQPTTDKSGTNNPGNYFSPEDNISDSFLTSECPTLIDNSVQCLMSSKSNGDIHKNIDTTPKKASDFSGTNSGRKNTPTMKHFSKTSITTIKKNGLTDINISEKETAIDSRLPVSFSSETFFQIVGTSSRLQNISNIIETVKNQLMKTPVEKDMSTTNDIIEKLDEILKVMKSLSQKPKNNSLNQDSQFPKLLSGPQTTSQIHEVHEKQASKKSLKFDTSQKMGKKIKRRSIKIRKKKHNTASAKERTKEEQRPEVTKFVKLPVFQNENYKIETATKASKIPIEKALLPEYKQQMKPTSDIQNLKSRTDELEPMAPKEKQSSNNIKRKFDDKNESQSVNNYVNLLKSYRKKDKLSVLKKKHVGFFEHRSLSKRDKKILKEILKGTPKKKKLSRVRRYKESPQAAPKELETVKKNAKENSNQEANQSSLKEPLKEMSFAEKIKATFNPFASNREELNAKGKQSREIKSTDFSHPTGKEINKKDLSIPSNDSLDPSKKTFISAEETSMKEETNNNVLVSERKTPDSKKKTDVTTPKKVPSSPKKTTSNPKEVVTTPKNVSSPKKIVSTPKKYTVSTPETNVTSLKKVVNSPKNENKSGDVKNNIQELPERDSIFPNLNRNTKTLKTSYVERTPNKILSTPEKDIKTTEKLVGTPKKVVTSPNKNITTPKKPVITSKKAVTTPKKAVTTPKKAVTTPKKAVTTPKKAVTTPKKAVTTPKKAVTTPKKAVSKTKKMVTTPKKIISSPKKITSNPKEVVTTPDRIVNTPKKYAVNTPEMNVTSSKKVASPLQKVLPPSREVVNSPKTFINIPLKIEDSPNKAPQNIVSNTERNDRSPRKNAAFRKKVVPLKKYIDGNNPSPQEFNNNKAITQNFSTEKSDKIDRELENPSRGSNYKDLTNYKDSKLNDIQSQQNNEDISKDNKLDANKFSENVNELPVENASSKNKIKTMQENVKDDLHPKVEQVAPTYHEENIRKPQTPVKQPIEENLFSKKNKTVSKNRTNKISELNLPKSEPKKTFGEKTNESMTLQKEDTSKLPPTGNDNSQSRKPNPSYKIYVATKPFDDSKNKHSLAQAHKSFLDSNVIKDSNEHPEEQQNKRAEEDVLQQKTGTVNQVQDLHSNITVIEKKSKNVDTSEHQEKFQSDLMKSIKRKIELRNPINFRVKPVKVVPTQNDYLEETFSNSSNDNLSKQKHLKTETQKPKSSTEGGSKSVGVPPKGKRNVINTTSKQTEKLSISKSKPEERNKIYKTIPRGSAKDKTISSENPKTIKPPPIHDKAPSSTIKDDQDNGLSVSTVDNVKNQKNGGQINSITVQKTNQEPNEVQQKLEHSDATEKVNLKTEKSNELLTSKQETKESNFKGIRFTQDSVSSDQNKGLKDETNPKKMKIKLNKQSVKEKEKKSHLAQTEITGETSTKSKMVQQENEPSPFPMLLIDLDKMTKEIKPDFDLKNCNKCLVPLNQIDFYPLVNKKKAGEFVCPNTVLNICPSKDPVLRKDLSLLPSVTKILNLTLPKSSRQILREWRKNKIRDLGENGFKSFYKGQMTRGTQFHNLIQDHLVWGRRRETPSTLSFQSVHSIFSDLTDLAAINSHVVHKALAYRGVVDCVARYKGTPVVVEWKRLDEKPYLGVSSLESSYLQMSAYVGALNFDENYKFQVKGGIIVLAYSDGNKADVYELDQKECDKYWRLWLNRLIKYHSFVQSKNKKE